MMKRTVILLYFLLCHLLPSQAQLQMFFSSDSLSNITSPLDVDSLFYWFAADVAVLDSAGGTISGGEGVGTWTDLSGNGYNVVQADTTKDPRWCASCGPASYPAIVFNGVDEFLASSSHWWGSDDLTMFVVMKFGDATRNAIEIITTHKRLTGDVRQWDFRGTNTASSYNFQFYAFKSGTTTNQVFWEGGAKSTSYRCIVHTSIPATGTLFIDGTNTTYTRSIIGGGDGTIYDGSTAFSIGAQDVEGTPALFLQGSISEIIVYSRALTATERTAIENYLNRKYDLYYFIILAFPLASARRRKLIPNEKKNAA